jgi:CDP-diacylglycerol--glycerol-3-phosphate 3-phosphatidyltransferase
MMANLITFSRLIFLFAVFLLLDYGGFQGHVWGFLLTVLLMSLDMVDGIVARWLNETSEFGSVIDIIIDRIVENCFWVYFACRGVISLWIPLIVICRGFLTDGIRSVALANGMTAFGEKSLQTSWLGKNLVSSHISRGLYNSSKIISFLFLIFVHSLTLPNSVFPGGKGMMQSVTILGYATVYFTVVFCIVRAIPVYLDSRPFLSRVRKEQ